MSKTEFASQDLKDSTRPIFRNISYNGNITSDNIDSMVDTQIGEAYFQSGTPYVTTWGMLIVSKANNGVIDQCQITPKGIAIRHYEGGTWSTWKKVALS